MILVATSKRAQTLRLSITRAHLAFTYYHSVTSQFPSVSSMLQRAAAAACLWLVIYVTLYGRVRRMQWRLSGTVVAKQRLTRPDPIKWIDPHLETDTGQVLARSDPVFASMAEAEAELIAVLQGLSK
jgi:hypothetical protein